MEVITIIAGVLILNIVLSASVLIALREEL